MNTKDFYKVFDEYAEVFGDAFPTMEHQGKTDDEIYEMMVTCIKRNEPASVVYPVNLEYTY